MMFFIQSSMMSQSLQSKANTQFEMKNYSEALKTYLSACADDPTNPEILSRIALCYYRLNDMLNASKWYDRVITQDEVSPDDLLRSGLVNKSLKLYGKAKPGFDRYSMVIPAIGDHYAKSCDYAMNAVKAEPLYDLTNAYFNTSQSDFGVTQWNDKLVFTSFRTDIAKTRRASLNASPRGVSELFVIDPNATPVTVKLLFDDLSDHGQMGPIAFSGNGKFVAVTKNNFDNALKTFIPEDNQLSIYLASVDESGSWEELRPFPFNDNAYSTGYPWLSEDGQVMFFASNMNGGFGGYDLYVSYKENGQWSVPKNLGSEINTPGHEISPFKSSEHFYFSSDYHTGIGGLDIFQTNYSDGEWDKVMNLGVGVNSSRDDFGYVVSRDGQTAYLSSDRSSGRGKLDIYKAQPNIKAVTFQVTHRDTDNPISECVIRFKDSGLELRTDEDGMVTTNLSRRTTSDIVVEADGYHQLQMRLANFDLASSEMHYDIQIDKISVEQKENQKEISTEVIASRYDASIQKPHAADKEVSISNEPKESLPIVKANTETKSHSASTDHAMESIVASKPKRKVYVKQKPVEKFAVQVAAFSKGNFDADRYTNLNSFGTVAPVQESQMTKVRVGSFDDEESARRAMKSIRSVGYRDAFVVKQMVYPSSTEGTWTEHMQDTSNEYKVRLVTYSKSGKFDASQVEHIGRLESYRKNEMTIMLLAGYTTHLDAQRATEQAKKLGFVDAYVVRDEGGILRKVYD